MRALAPACAVSAPRSRCCGQAHGGSAVALGERPSILRSRRGWARPARAPAAVAEGATAADATSFLPLLLADHPGLAVGSLCNSVVFTLGFKVLRKGLTPAGVAHAWFLGTSVFAAFGAGGYALVCVYFIIGTLVTKIKLEQKQKEGIAEARSGQRGPSSVWGSGIAGVACAVLAIASGTYDPFQIGFVASFCSKLSDTVSSEIGKAYGKTTYLITTLQPVPRGTEGAISLEGTLAGALTAVVFAGLGLLAGQVPNLAAACAVAAAATAANLAESYLGASVQGRVDWMTNDVVNMLQISLAAAIAMALRVTVLAGP